MTEGSKPKRKERVLHTRVPDLLEKELKRLATSMRMPVSNVVRAILEDAVETVDTVGRKAEGEVRGIAERLGDRLRTTARKLETDRQPSEEHLDSFEDDSISEDTPRPPLHGVVGYQSLLLAKSAPCAICGRELDQGSEAFLCIRGEPGPRAIVGPECMPLPARERSVSKT